LHNKGFAVKVTRPLPGKLVYCPT